MTLIPAVIAWAFTLTFIIALVLILLDVGGVRRIQDETQRKWLFRSLFASVILAVLGFGTWQFDALKGGDDPAPVEKNIAKRKAPARPVPPPPSEETEPPPATEEPDGPSASPEVLTWAQETLGERPGIPAAFDRNYPACVAELRGRSYEDVEPTAASECLNLLNQHHFRYIVPFYRLKESYDRALASQEAAIRRGGIREDERARYNFVVAENEDFNDPGGPTLRRIEEAEERIRQDKLLCRTRRCTSET